MLHYARGLHTTAEGEVRLRGGEKELTRALNFTNPHSDRSRLARPRTDWGKFALGEVLNATPSLGGPLCGFRPLVKPPSPPQQFREDMLEPVFEVASSSL